VNSGHAFYPGKRFTWKEMDYLVLARLPEGRLNLTRLEDGEVCTVGEQHLLDALFRERTLHFPLNFEGQVEHAPFSDAPEHLQRIARWRHRVIAPLLDLPSGKLGVGSVELRIAEVLLEPGESAPRSLSKATVYRWIRQWRESGGDLRALLPGFARRGGKGTSRLGDVATHWVEQALEEHSARSEAWTLVDVHHRVCDVAQQHSLSSPETPRIPSLSSVYRLARKLDRLPARERRGRQYQGSDHLTSPLERVEIDHWKSDLIVVDDLDRLPLGRLNLTFMLCSTTRYPLGYYLGFEPPGGYALAECVHHAVMPKESSREKYGTEHDWQAYGLPARVRVDNGLEFRSAGFQAAMGHLGVVYEACPVRSPQFKGGIERSFRTLGQGLFHTLPGTTFSGLLERQDKNYDSMSEACIPLQAIDRILHTYLLDVYAEGYHRGLGGVPARSWERHLDSGFVPLLPSSAQELSVLLGESETRTLHHYGLDWDSLRYQSEVLAELRDRVRNTPVQVRRVRSDLSRIYVHHPLEGRWLEVPVVVAAQDYARGLSVWKHRVVLRYLRGCGDPVNLAALGRAKRRIQELIEASYSQLPGGSRTRGARWTTAGQPTRTLPSDSEIFQGNRAGLSGGANPATTEPLPALASSLAPLTLPERLSEGWSVVPAPTLPPAPPRKRGW